MRGKTLNLRTFVLFTFPFLLVALGWTLPLRGQTEPVEDAEAKKEARKLFEDGVLLFEKGRFASALEKFSRSYELRKHWKILYNIGMCYLELGDLPKAATMLSEFLEAGGRDIEETVVEEVTGILRKTKAKLGVMRLTGHFEAGILTVDGNEDTRGAQGKDVFLAPGVHHVRLTRGEDVLLDTRFTIEAGEEKEIFVLEHKPAAVSPIAPAMEETPPPHVVGPSPEEEEKRRAKERRKKTGWAFFGTALVLATAGAVAGGMALAGKNEVVATEEEYKRDFERLSPQELDQLLAKRNEQFDEAWAYSIASTALFSAAGVSALLSFIMLPLGYKKERAPEKTARSIQIVPTPLGICARF